MFHSHPHGGFIKMIILIIIAIIVLSYFGFDLQSIIESPTAQKNLNYAKEFVVHIWDAYLKAPATYLWDIWVKYIWSAFIKAMEAIKSGGTPELFTSGPSVNFATSTQ